MFSLVSPTSPGGLDATDGEGGEGRGRRGRGKGRGRGGEGRRRKEGEGKGEGEKKGRGREGVAQGPAHARAGSANMTTHDVFVQNGAYATSVASQRCFSSPIIFLF